MGSSSTVSKNPVAVPTELYAAPVEAQAMPMVVEQRDDLQAIDHELNNGNYDIAQQQLAQLTLTNGENPALKTNLLILQTKLALLTGNPKQAITWLNQLDLPLSANPTQQHYLMQLRIQALYRTNQILASALANIKDNSDNMTIWNKLLMINPANLQTQQTHTRITGWFALAQIAQYNANNFNSLKNTLLQWQQTYPYHPANSLLAELNNPALNQTNTSTIAAILPLSGSYATLGQSVQQGLLAAYYSSSAKANQRITFYDSNADSISTIYEKIQTNGDQLILGPLTKEDTESLLRIAKDSPQIINLNYTNIKTPLSHFEFGLSPEDEARQIAELAWRQGKSSAIIIAPKTTKGEQTANAFMQAWTNLGGQVVDRYNYANSDDFSKSIASLLEVTNSQWRQHTLKTTLGIRMTSSLYFRKDADMVFLTADPKSARQIRPFIKFYAGDYLSIFATSSIYSGIPNTNNDKDLNDVYFCDMPAILTNTSLQHNRLYFLGVDSYLLAMQQMHLNTLPHFPLFGTTGHLTVNASHNIQRELICAQFKNGRPTPLNTSS